MTTFVITNFRGFRFCTFSIRSSINTDLRRVIVGDFERIRILFTSIFVGSCSIYREKFVGGDILTLSFSSVLGACQHFPIRCKGSLNI